jgi:predicted extracellular nuclease
MSCTFGRFLSVSVLSGVLAALVASPASAASNLVISQVYGGGGNSGATYTHDFIEVFNRGTTNVNLNGWSVQYASATGTTWAVTPLGGTLLPGRYYLIQEAQGTGGTTPLPTPDATGTITMSATTGKVALVHSTTALSGACPTGYTDLVGFGTANCAEGTLMASLSNTTAGLRALAGCQDMDDNSVDFSTGAPTPRNTASPATICGTVSTDPTAWGRIKSQYR